MPALAYPPFPEDVPTVPLLVIDYALIKLGDTHEIDRLWKAATELGFWYLRNYGADDLAEAMFEMGEETMRLPLDEKMKFEQGDGGMSFGYKSAGANAVDEHGTRDAVEFINVAQDDALAWPRAVHRAYPRTVGARMASAVAPFVEASLGVNDTLLRVLNARLGLPEGALAARHLRHARSGSETRVIRTPPLPDAAPDKAALGAHTDFGSLSFLHNRVGGLQVLPPGSDGWKYVKPIPGHAICNVGDALSIFSAGILRSNLHRVVTPPQSQRALTRWSLVFFTRPNNEAQLEPLVEESSAIRAAAAAAAQGRYDTHATAEEWFARRIRNQRVNNRTGPETWRASRGTEHRVDAV